MIYDVMMSRHGNSTCTCTCTSTVLVFIVADGISQFHFEVKLHVPLNEAPYQDNELLSEVNMWSFGGREQVSISFKVATVRYNIRSFIRNSLWAKTPISSLS